MCQSTGGSWVFGDLQTLGHAGFGAFCSTPIAAFNGGTFHTFSRPSLYGSEAAPHMECLPGSSALLRDEPW